MTIFSEKKCSRILVFAVLVISLLFLSLSFSHTALAESDLRILGQSCILIDAQTGEILYSQNVDLQWYPASVTKIMTLVLALEAVNDGRFKPEDIVTTSKEAADMGGSQVYLYEGEQRSLHEMLIAVAVGSGNDAAYAVAEFIGGSHNGFIEMMNKRAGELGMSGTNYVNPHGLHDENHYTTAADLAKLALHALSVKGFLDYTSIYEYKFREDPKPLVLWNTNRLLKWYEGTDGMKTGFTQEAKYNLVTTVVRDKMRLISVVLGVPERNGHFTESMKLLNYGFSQFEYVPIYPAGQILGTVSVQGGKVDSVEFMPSGDVGVLQKRGDKSEITARIICRSDLIAPIAKGEQVGELILMKGDAELSRFPLVVAHDVEKGTWSISLKKLFRHIGL